MTTPFAIFIKSLAVIAFLSGIIFSQYFFDIYRTRASDEKLTVLSASTIRTLDLGLHSAISSILWIRALQRAGAFRSKAFASDLRLVNDLDPKFSYPYAYGVLLLSSFKMAQEAILVGERGIREADPDWRIPYYLAVIYHTAFHDRAKALQNLELAARTPGVYEGIQKVVALYGTQPNLREETKALWRGIYETSKDETVRERAAKFILHLEIMDLLERGAKIYHEKYGKFPKTPADLIAAQILSEMPDSPLGFEYDFGEEGNVLLKNPADD